MEIAFAILLGLAALWCLWNAFQARSTSRRAATGYAIAGVSALVQVLNILGRMGSSYSIFISVITTIGLIGGFWLTREPARPHPGA